MRSVRQTEAEHGGKTEQRATALTRSDLPTPLIIVGMKFGERAFSYPTEHTTKTFTEEHIQIRSSCCYLFWIFFSMWAVGLLKTSAHGARVITHIPTL